MCGIVGWFDLKDHRSCERTLLHAMSDALAHRGPDDEGYVLLGRDGFGRALRGPDTILDLESLPSIDSVMPQEEIAALGFRRLSIIELSSAGHMPMLDPATGTFTGTITLTGASSPSARAAHPPVPAAQALTAAKRGSTSK